MGLFLSRYGTYRILLGDQGKFQPALSEASLGIAYCKGTGLDFDIIL